MTDGVPRRSGVALPTKSPGEARAQNPAQRYVARLLGDLDAHGAAPDAGADLVSADSVNDGVAEDWAASGLIPLCGMPQSQPAPGPGAIPTCARGALDAFRAIARQDVLPGVNGAALLAERAAMLQLSRRGRVSANGTCHLLEARDGWIALNLAREEDRALLPAWLETRNPDLPRVVATRSSEVLLDRGRLLGLPIAGLGEVRADTWMTLQRVGKGKARRANVAPLVIDLSALWAGPLCTHLLRAAGARVIKVESARRPDASRQGSAEFFDLLNAGKQSVALDLPSRAAAAQLTKLLAQADIVVESARPRALEQMGIDATDLITTNPGLTWIGITGYGRQAPMRDWVAFGDDAAVGAGIVGAGPSFCGDAIADPLTGLHAAVAALACCNAGGGMLIDVSLAGVGSFCLRHGAAEDSAAGTTPLASAPRAREVARPAHAFGADTDEVLQEFACS